LFSVNEFVPEVIEVFRLRSHPKRHVEDAPILHQVPDPAAED